MHMLAGNDRTVPLNRISTCVRGCLGMTFIRGSIGVMRIAVGIVDTHGACRDHGRDGVLVDHLADAVLEQHHMSESPAVSMSS